MTFKYIAAAKDDENISSYKRVRQKQSRLFFFFFVTIPNAAKKKKKKKNLSNRKTERTELVSILASGLGGVIGDKNQLLPLLIKSNQIKSFLYSIV